MNLNCNNPKSPTLLQPKNTSTGPSIKSSTSERLWIRGAPIGKKNMIYVDRIIIEESPAGTCPYLTVRLSPSPWRPAVVPTGTRFCPSTKIVNLDWTFNKYWIRNLSNHSSLPSFSFPSPLPFSLPQFWKALLSGST